VEPIAHLEFSDGTIRPFYREDGRYFIVRDDGQRLAVEWIVDEPERYDLPVIVGPDVPSFE
jgi:hypothetical protein